MNQRQLGSVLFAALGAFIAITLVPQIVVAGGLLAQSAGLSNGASNQAVPAAYSITLFIGTLIAALLGILLMLLRDRLAERLFSADGGPLAAREAQAVALSVLGCYFVIQAISRLVRLLRPIDWSAATQLVLGVGLFLGSRGVARLWAAARTAGSPGPDERAS
jgi:hypothetical protein